MPVCTTCTLPIEHLYTVYQSENNLRLEQCPRCLCFADPYVEYDSLALLLDLILLKRGVYRHLLFNRGTSPKRAPGATAVSGVTKSTIESNAEEREQNRRWTVFKLGITLMMIDAFIRWSNHYPMGVSILGEATPWNREARDLFIKTLAGCFTETVSFHVGVTTGCVLVLRLLRMVSRKPPSAIRLEFRASHVPLTLLYSSLTKLFLLFMLSIWRPENAVSASTSWKSYSNPVINSALELLDEDKLDRQWVVRNILGGMAAGFGLRGISNTWGATSCG
ncbi:Arv1-like family-domain-containing protein [Gautieria morchelliformis]|nr:Arv1-like family-domain-containing protein [Gautieria morchelliformis]